MSRQRRERTGWALALLLPLLFVAAQLAAADFNVDLTELREISPRPGTTVGAANIERFAHLVDKDFRKFLEGDFAHLAVGEPVSFLPHAAFIHATKRFSGQTTVGAAPGTLDNFVQGLPFPGTPSSDDPSAGLKVAWNMRYAYTGDSGVIPEMHWQLRDWRSSKIEFEMLFEARTMRFMYRHVQDPIPFIEKNPQDAYGAFLLNAIDAGSYDDTQALVFANRDESREINGWVFIPQLGRSQSLASFSTEESMFGSDILPTDFLIYSSRLTDMKWTYKGTSFMLLPMYRHDRVELAHKKARKHDYWHVDFAGRAGCFPKVNWQVRPVFILEGEATDPSAHVSRRVLYLDQQTHVAPFWKVYREDGGLWKFVIASYAHPNSHVRHNNESGAPILTAFSTIDIQTNRCTTMQLLTVVNTDDVQAKDFETSRMQSGSGRSFRR